MTRQTYRASSYQDRPQRAEGSILDKAVWHDDELGFRLTVDTSAERVLRGGSWLFSAQYSRVANRYGNDPSIRINYLGFRLAKEGA
jgi:formylglycine-generating enzyme required for sulfatase activity